MQHGDTTNTRCGTLGLKSGLRSSQPGGRIGVITLREGRDERPLVWGLLQDCYRQFESLEELDAVLRAASYRLGLPQMAVREMREMIERTGFVRSRTQGEMIWRAALKQGQRIEDDDRYLTQTRRIVSEALAAGQVNYAPGEPFCLDQNMN